MTDSNEPSISREKLESTIGRLQSKLAELQHTMSQCIVGQQENISSTFFALLARGHCLIEGVPGLGKTLLVRALARVLDLDFARIQFTPDLMPADITGSVILRDDEEGRRKFVFVRGPIFTNILLADEINRTPPKTQAALLESMQEKTVTVSGSTHDLADPFLVLATQNPIEQEGTYPLPEAQLDRFLFQLQVGYPTQEEEKAIVAQHSFTPLERLKPVITREEIVEFRAAVDHIPAAPNVIDYATRIVRATRPKTDEANPNTDKWLRWGASPRASLNLILAGRARAATLGRFHVSCEDVAALAKPILRHRVIPNFHADAEGVSVDEIIDLILESVPNG